LSDCWWRCRLAATIGVLVRFALRRYLESSLYTGKPSALSGEGDTLSVKMARMDHSFGPRQLVLALDHAVSFAREDFLGGPSNAAALDLIERWPDWPNRIMALVGPEGSGKSCHLASIWAETTGARILSAKLFAGNEPAVGLRLPVALVVEDLDPGDLDERALFSR